MCSVGKIHWVRSGCTKITKVSQIHFCCIMVWVVKIRICVYSMDWPHSGSGQRTNTNIFNKCLGSTQHLCRSDPAKMIVLFLILVVFATCGDPRPSTLDTPLIVEGDIAVTERSAGSGTALNSFRTAQESVWPDGIVPYRFDVDFWTGDSVFFEAQRDNISEALRKIENGVPCIEFRWDISN